MLFAEINTLGMQNVECQAYNLDIPTNKHNVFRMLLEQYLTIQYMYLMKRFIGLIIYFSGGMEFIWKLNNSRFYKSIRNTSLLKDLF